jgi:hypothetical protein
MKLELIQSVNPVIPSKGTNAGKQMFVINGKHWSKTEPSREETHVCLEDVEVITKDDKGKDVKTNYTNVIGFSKDSRMSINEKIALLTSVDAGYSQAIAMLLK